MRWIFIKRPIGVFTICTALAFLGVLALLNIPTSLLPEIPIPEVNVLTSAPNYSAREIEENISKKLKNNLISVSGIKDLTTNSQDGLSSLQIYFDHNTDIQTALFDVNERIDQSISQLPNDINRPKVVHSLASDLALFDVLVNIKAHSDRGFSELSDLSRFVLKKRFEQLPTIGLADLGGFSTQEIVIIPNRSIFNALKIDISIISNAIIQNNSEIQSVKVSEGNLNLELNFDNKLKNIEDLRRISVNVGDKIYLLSELATITFKNQHDNGAIYSGQKRAVNFRIIKDYSSQTDECKKETLSLIKNLEREYSDLEFNLVNDQAGVLESSISNLTTSLWLGSVSAIIILLLFLGSWKSITVLLLTMPLSLLSSVLIFYIVGLTLNVVTLSGLILGIGLMIDNSILVMDNIWQKTNTESDLEKACIEGTHQIVGPLLSSVLSNCAVFIPIIFIGDVMGTIFYSQAISIIIGLFTSLLISIIVLPVLYFQLFSTSHVRLKTTRFSVISEKLYTRLSNNLINRKRLFLICYTLLGGLLFSLNYSIPTEVFPKLKYNSGLLKIDWNENITTHENQKRIQSIFSESEVVSSFHSEIGLNQFLINNNEILTPSNAFVYFKCKSYVQKQQGIKELTSSIKRLFPRAIYSFNSPKDLFSEIFDPNQPDVLCKIYPTKQLSLSSINRLVLSTQLKKANPIKTINYLRLTLDREKAILYNLVPDQLTSEIETILNGNEISFIQTSNQNIPVKISNNQFNIDSLFNNIYLNQNTDPIPISEFLDIGKSLKLFSINSDLKGEYLSFNFNNVDNISALINQLNSELETEKDLSYSIEGTFLENENIKHELIFLLSISIIIIFLILAAQFESIWKPFLVLLEIPFAIAGAFLFLNIFNESLNLMSSIGIIIMTGIIINDSILKVHTYTSFERSTTNLTVIEIIKKTGNLRLKPILMTSFSTILALTPILFSSGLGSDLQKPLALALIGGLILGTFSSLFLIPILYYFFQNVKQPNKLKK